MFHFTRYKKSVSTEKTKLETKKYAENGKKFSSIGLHKFASGEISATFRNLSHMPHDEGRMGLPQKYKLNRDTW